MDIGIIIDGKLYPVQNDYTQQMEEEGATGLWVSLNATEFLLVEMTKDGRFTGKPRSVKRKDGVSGLLGVLFGYEPDVVDK